MSKEDVMLLRAALVFYRERCERSRKASVHVELTNFYTKEIGRIDDVISKLEIV